MIPKRVTAKTARYITNTIAILVIWHWKIEPIP